jgi:hypothetical protein
MRPSPLLLLVMSALLASAEARAQLDGGELPTHRVADASAAPVTPANLLASERFWPYQVALARPWRPPGHAEPLAPGIAGVLIRVEDAGVARIDFGRDGLYRVPVEVTDLIERANRIRLGELEKLAPNFVLDVGPRLADSAPDSLRPFGLRAALERDSFLCVFADPSAPGFAELAGAMAKLRERAGLLTILFAQGAHPDARLRELLRSLDWPVPFVLDHLAEPYTRSLLGEGTALPAVLLVTKEGRVRFQGSWAPDVLPALETALDRPAPGGATAEAR